MAIIQVIAGAAFVVVMILQLVGAVEVRRFAIEMGIEEVMAQTDDLEALGDARPSYQGLYIIDEVSDEEETEAEGNNERPDEKGTYVDEKLIDL